MLASGDFERFGDAADREVVAFGPAAGEDDLRRIAADQGGVALRASSSAALAT